jgi:hypothetical protein
MKNAAKIRVLFETTNFFIIKFGKYEKKAKRRTHWGQDNV